MISWLLQYPMHTQFRVSTNSLTWNILLSWLDRPPRFEPEENWDNQKKQVTACQIWKYIFWKLFWPFWRLKFVFFKVFKWRFCFENARWYDAVTLPSSTDFKLSATVVLENGRIYQDTKLTIEVWKIVKIKSL